MHQLYYNNSKWIDQDLTSGTGGSLANLGSGISSYAIADGHHVYYVASTVAGFVLPRHVHQLYYNNSKWIDQDLTASTQATFAAPWSPLSSYAIGDGQHVYYVTLNQHVHQLYYNNSKWIDQDLTSGTGGPLVAPASGISSYAVADGHHVYYVGQDQHMHQLYYNNTSWSDQDLTKVANGPATAPPDPISSFAITDGQHVYYLVP
jgi:hypothetical protein